MTVIAWDGQFLASDRRITSGYTISTTRKIFRLEDGIIGFAGCATGINHFLSWFGNDRELKTFPEILYDHEFGVAALFIDKKKRVWEFQYSGSPILITTRHAAIGSGDEAALAAMMCGKNAIEAVKIVSKYNCSCGNGYDVLKLINNKKINTKNQPKSV
jgi:20S proteasome alpha/beta subunit